MNGTERPQINSTSIFLSKERHLWGGLTCLLIFTLGLTQLGSQESSNLCPWALGIGSDEAYKLASVDRIELEFLVEALKAPQKSWQRSPKLTTTNSTIKTALREELEKHFLKSNYGLKSGEKISLPAQFDGMVFSTVFHIKKNDSSNEKIELILWDFDPLERSLIQSSSLSIQLGPKTTVLRGLQAGKIEQTLVQSLSSHLKSQPPPLVRGILESLRLSQQGRRLSSSLRAQRRVDNRSQWPYLYLARIDSDEGRTSEALHHWQQALFRGELNALNLAFYADDLNRATRFIEAESFLRRALKKLDPQVDSTLVNSLSGKLETFSYRASQERELALQSAQAQRKIIELVKRQSKALSKSEKDPEIEKLKERIKKNPQHLELRRDLIHILLKQGLFTQAVRELNVIKVTPKNKNSIREIRAEILLRGSWPEKVIQFYQENAVDDLPSQACILLGDAHLALSQTTFRIQRWTEYSDTCFPRLEDYSELEKPTDPEQLKHWDQAGLYYEKAKKIKFGARAECRWVEWQFLNGNSNLDSLIDLLKPIEDYLDSKRVLSQLILEKGEKENGLRLFLIFAVDQPKDLQTRIEFVDWALDSDLQLSSRDYLEFLKIINRCLEDDPSSIHARNQKVRLLLKLERLSEAKEEIQIILAAGRAGWEYLKSAWVVYRIGPRAGRPAMQVSRQINESSLPGSPNTFREFAGLHALLAFCMLQLEEPEKALLVLSDFLNYFLVREQARLKWTRSNITNREVEWTRMATPKLEPVDFQSDRERRLWSNIDLNFGESLYMMGELERARFHVSRAARRVAVRNGKVLKESDWGEELSPKSLSIVIRTLELILLYHPKEQSTQKLSEWISELSKHQQ